MDDSWDVSKAVRTFDAFPKASHHYVTHSSRGGIMTIIWTILTLYLAFHELSSWFGGQEEHQFSVAREIGDMMQINIDMTVAMPCDVIQVNVQSATGDRVLAQNALTLEGTTFDTSSSHLLTTTTPHSPPSLPSILRASKKRKFPSRKLIKNADACRIYGSLDVDKVQGDLHITTVGHGYQTHSPQHLAHEKMNFSHVIDELSFGAFYPKLENPLDMTASVTEEHWQTFKYFLSIVPTTYISTLPPSHSIHTNQYAVTSQSRPSPATHSGGKPPGIFFQYDIEPLELTVRDKRAGMGSFLVRVAGVLGGVFVCAEWGLKGWDVVLRKKLGRGEGEGGEGEGLLSPVEGKAYF
ncbi:hypothetical protein YB2330_002775 [Saitoella coloradoensis]